MGSSAPPPDPNIGIAAAQTAATGEAMFQFMQDQADITNGWAEADRARYDEKFVPEQDAYIEKSKTWASPERKASEAAAASANVAQQASLNQGAMERNAMAMGVNPNSGAYASASQKATTDTALAQAGAKNLSNQQIEAEAQAMQANVINMGSGLAVNPATSMGLSNGAVSSGGSAAMNGYSAQADMLNTQHNQQMSSYEANNASTQALLGSIGSVVGMIPSSKKIKENKKPVDALAAIEGMPVEQWDYKSGEGDGGTHIGPYAEDFQKSTGMGDGKSIDAISMIGVTLGAVRELAEKVKSIEAAVMQSEPMGVERTVGQDPRMAPTQAGPDPRRVGRSGQGRNRAQPMPMGVSA
jgi:hypothetical protein